MTYAEGREMVRYWPSSAWPGRNNGTNSVSLAGHAVVGDHVFLGENAAVHQFVRVDLQAQKEDIEKEFGEPLVWQEFPGKKSIRANSQRPHALENDSDRAVR